MHYCSPDASVDEPKYEEEFSNDGAKYYWSAPINKFHSVFFDYLKGNLPLKATCIVVHTPMKWNFWHFSLRWEINEGKLSELEGNAKKNAAKKIGHAVRVIISEFASMVQPADSSLDQSCYCKN